MKNSLNPELLRAFFEPIISEMVETHVEQILSQKLKETQFSSTEEKPVPVDEISKMLGYSKSHVYTLCKQRKLPHVRKGERYYFYVSAVNKWIQSI